MRYLGFEGQGGKAVSVTDGSSESFASWGPQVHQTTGMIVAQDTAEAVLRLVDHARANGRTVQEAAVEVVEAQKPPPKA